MHEIYSARKIIGGAGLRIEPDCKMGLQAKIDQYGEGGEEGEGKSVMKLAS